jgi:predicted enzyme related to lactoylglutathione lyase
MVRRRTRRPPHGSPQEVNVKLAQARIVTSDVSRLAQFYEHILDVQAAGSEEYVELRTPGATLAISSERAAALGGAGSAVPAQNRSVILDFEVRDVDATHRRLADFIGSFVLEPTTQPWRNRAMLFHDPDGNLINVFSAAYVRGS